MAAGRSNSGMRRERAPRRPGRRARARLLGGDPVSVTAEVAAATGAGYVVVDQQHGGVGPAETIAMLQAHPAAGAAGLVRVPRNDPWLIGHPLDLGALGVIVPMVESGEEAARAVAACRYAPDGERSIGLLRGAADGGEPLCLVMVETRAALERVEEIAATPGLDGIYIGPSDLALSHGLQPTHAARAPAGRRGDRARAGGVRGARDPLRAALPRRQGRRALLRVRRVRAGHRGPRPRATSAAALERALATARGE